MTHFIFDCDDVLLDWQGAFIKFCSTHGLTLDPAGPETWDMRQWMAVSPEMVQRFVTMFNSSPEFALLRPCTGAFETVWRLHDAGHLVSVLTACGDRRAIARARSENLHAAFSIGPLSPFRHDLRPDRDWNLGLTVLPLNASKFEHLYKLSRKTGDLVYVEDAYHHAVSGAVNGIKTYCLRKSHNRHHEGAHDSKIIWIDNLTEILP